MMNPPVLIMNYLPLCNKEGLKTYDKQVFNHAAKISSTNVIFFNHFKQLNYWLCLKKKKKRKTYIPLSQASIQAKHTNVYGASTGFSQINLDKVLKNSVLKY